MSTALRSHGNVRGKPKCNDVGLNEGVVLGTVAIQNALSSVMFASKARR